MAERRGARLARRLPGGLRARLAVLISLLTVAIIAGIAIAVERGTKAELEGRLDDELALQVKEFESFGPVGRATTADELERAAKRFVSSQRYHPSSTIFAISVDGAGLVTNQPELLGEEVEHLEEDGEAEGGEDEEGAVLRADPGLSEIETEETGSLRVLVVEVAGGGTTAATFRVAEPRESIEDAEAGLGRTLAIVGAIALAVAIAGALWIAARIARPLRRISAVASAVDAGDLEPRIGELTTGDELEQLASSFDGMLDRLEAAFRRQRDFVSDASHELRTPLTILRGQLDRLRGDDLDPAERERVLEVVRREVRRMERLVDDLLLLARAEAGTLIEPRPVDVADIIEDLRRDMPLFGDRDFHVAPAPPGTIEADPERLSQVFRNLVGNAVEHTDSGDVVAVETTADDGVLRIAITDSGTGIDPAELDRLFDRFHRVDPARSPDGGAGLGLAIARAIVVAHGGTIRAESRPGRGSTFTLELPGLKPPSRA